VRLLAKYKSIQLRSGIRVRVEPHDLTAVAPLRTCRRAEPSEAHPPSPRLRRVPTSHSSTGLHPWPSAEEGKKSDGCDPKIIKTSYVTVGLMYERSKSFASCRQCLIDGGASDTLRRRKSSSRLKTQDRLRCTPCLSFSSSETTEIGDTHASREVFFDYLA
jgi:hypothetical protein